jgi:ElaB/YqjD/DUF883 family membrane-anchored ribosome-binding protein
MRSQRDSVTGAAGEEAKDMITGVAQTARDTVVDLGARAAEAGATAGEYARDAGRQVTAAAQSAYGTGGDILDVVEDFARENVWSSLLIAGAIGFGLAALTKGKR